MRFEVNNHSYMLSFNRDDDHWYLITDGVDGRMKAIAVIGDEAGFVANVVVPMDSGGSGQAGIN